MKIALLFRTVAWATHKPNTHQSTEWEVNILSTNNRKAPRALTHIQAHAHALSELTKNKTKKRNTLERAANIHLRSFHSTFMALLQFESGLLKTTSATFATCFKNRSDQLYMYNLIICGLYCSTCMSDCLCVTTTSFLFGFFGWRRKRFRRARRSSRFGAMYECAMRMNRFN